jgi:hypothetical protein
LGFLGPWLFRFENPDSGGWNSLDFLGFSRMNPDLSMGYTGFSLKIFSVTLLPLGTSKRRTGKATGEAMRSEKCASIELNLYSDFLQSNVPDPLFPRQLG